MKNQDDDRKSGMPSQEPPLFTENDLPPITDDQVLDDPKQFGSYLHDFEQDPSAGDDSVPRAELNRDDLSDFNETGSWLDEGVSENAEKFCEVDSEGNEDSWIDSSTSGTPDLAGFSLENYSTLLQKDDPGADGPTEEERVIIDESGFDDISGWNAEPEETVYEAMERLGVEMTELLKDSDAGTRTKPDRHEAVYMGPEGAKVYRVAFWEGRLAAAGDALFVSASDGMLYPVDMSSEIASQILASLRSELFPVAGTDYQAQPIEAQTECSDTPGWVLRAVRENMGETSVRLSVNGGKTFETIFTARRTGETTHPEAPIVYQLVTELAQQRRLYVVTCDGVFRIVLPVRETSH